MIRFVLDTGEEHLEKDLDDKDDDSGDEDDDEDDDKGDKDEIEVYEILEGYRVRWGALITVEQITSSRIEWTKVRVSEEMNICIDLCKNSRSREQLLPSWWRNPMKCRMQLGAIHLERLECKLDESMY
jgi:hypothetical protein